MVVYTRTIKVRPEDQKEAARKRASGRAVQVEVTTRSKSLLCFKNK